MHAHGWEKLAEDALSLEAKVKVELGSVLRVDVTEADEGVTLVSVPEGMTVSETGVELGRMLGVDVTEAGVGVTSRTVPEELETSRKLCKDDLKRKV